MDLVLIDEHKMRKKQLMLSLHRSLSTLVLIYEWWNYSFLELASSRKRFCCQVASQHLDQYWRGDRPVSNISEPDQGMRANYDCATKCFWSSQIFASLPPKAHFHVIEGAIGRQFYTYISSLTSHWAMGRMSHTSNSGKGPKSFRNHSQVRCEAFKPLLCNSAEGSTSGNSKNILRPIYNRVE